jgi:hypothetical protein
MPCRNFKHFIEAQTAALRKAIDENKWYLSEKERHDVGTDVAQRDFTERYCMIWAAAFQAGFCAACEFPCRRKSGEVKAVGNDVEAEKKMEAST